MEDLTRQAEETPEEKEDKVIIFHGFSDEQIQDIIDLYVEEEMPECYFAATTPQSRLKRLRDVINEIIKEHREQE